MNKPDFKKYEAMILGSYMYRIVAAQPFKFLGGAIGSEISKRLTDSNCKIILSTLLSAALFRWGSYAWFTHKYSQNIKDRKKLKWHMLKSVAYTQVAGAAHTAIVASSMYYLHKKFGIDYTASFVVGGTFGLMAYFYLVNKIGHYTGLKYDYLPLKQGDLKLDLTEKMTSGQSGSIDDKF